LRKGRHLEVNFKYGKLLYIIRLTELFRRQQWAIITGTELLHGCGGYIS